MSLIKKGKLKKTKLILASALTMVGLFGIASQSKQILDNYNNPTVVKAIPTDLDGNRLSSKDKKDKKDSKESKSDGSEQTDQGNKNSAEDDAKNNNTKTTNNGDSKKSEEAEKNDKGNPEYQWDRAVDYNLSADPTYSDLYASVIFSKGNDNTVNRVSLSYDELKQYGAPQGSGGDGSSKDQIYGNLTQMDTQQKNGQIVANYLYTLNKYQWLSTHESDSSKNAVQKLWDSMVGAGKGAIAKFLLNTATFGAGLYDTFSNAIVSFGKFMGSIDIPAQFGFRTQSQGEQQNFINKLLSEVFSRLQMTKQSFEMISRFVWVILAAGAVVGIIAQLGKMQMNNATKLAGRLFLRVWVIGMTMYGTGFLQSIIDSFTNGMTNDMRAVVDYDRNYVVDTLDWATYGNLDISMIGSGTMESLAGSDKDAAAKKFEPTEENIRKLNDSISAVKQGADEETENKAVQYISDLASGTQANVNDYIAAIKNESNAAARKGPSGSSSISAGQYYSKKWYSNKFPPYVYFMSNNGSKDKDAKYETLTKLFEDPTDKEAEERQVSWYLFGPKDTVGQLAIPYIQTQSPYKFRRMKLSNPETYIYGASASNSEQTGNYNNFINGKGTDQNNDPMTASNDEYTGDGTLKIAMFTNSLGIAIDNRYGGVAAGKGGGQTLSTQSTAFVLQTALTDDKVLFQGYNTSVSTTDKGKSTEADGATFTRYIMPAKSKTARLVRMGALNTNWLLAGVCALLAFWYLLTAPMISAAIKMFASFFRALVTGNLISLLQYLAYYSAIQASFSFAQIAIFIGSMVGQLVLNYVPFLGHFINLSGGGVVTGAASVLTGTSIPSAAAIFVGLVMAFVMSWPIFTISFGNHNGKAKKVGLIGIVVLVPYTLAEAFDVYLDQFEQRLYGRSHRNSFVHKMGQKVRPINQGDQMKKLAQGALNVGAAAGMAFATGGASLAAQTAGKMALGKAIGSASQAMNPDDTSMEDFGDADERGVSLFGRIKSSYDDYKLGDKTLRDSEAFVESTERDDYLNRLNTPLQISPTDGLDQAELGETKHTEIADSKETTVEKADDTEVKAQNAQVQMDRAQLETGTVDLEDKKFNGLNGERNSREQNLLQGIHDELVDVEDAVRNQELTAKLGETPNATPLEVKSADTNIDADKSVVEGQTEGLDGKPAEPVKLDKGFIPKVEPTSALEQRLQETLMKNPKYNRAQIDYEAKADNYNAVKARYNEAIKEASNGSESAIQKAKALENMANVSLQQAQIAKEKRDGIRQAMLNRERSQQEYKDYKPADMSGKMKKAYTTSVEKAINLGQKELSAMAKPAGKLALGTASHMLGYQASDGLKNPFNPENNPLLKGHKEAVKARGGASLNDSKEIAKALKELNENMVISNELSNRMKDNLESTPNYPGLD